MAEQWLVAIIKKMHRMLSIIRMCRDCADTNTMFDNDDLINNNNNNNNNLNSN